MIRESIRPGIEDEVWPCLRRTNPDRTTLTQTPPPLPMAMARSSCLVLYEWNGNQSRGGRCGGDRVGLRGLSRGHSLLLSYLIHPLSSQTHTHIHTPISLAGQAKIDAPLSYKKGRCRLVSWPPRPLSSCKSTQTMQMCVRRAPRDNRITH